MRPCRIFFASIGALKNSAVAASNNRRAPYFGQWRTDATQWAHTRGMRSRGTGTTRTLPGSPFNQPPAVAIVASYAMSDRVSHDRYGLGTVIGIENGNAAVLVDFGPKVLRVALPTTKMVKL